MQQLRQTAVSRAKAAHRSRRGRALGAIIGLASIGLIGVIMGARLAEADAQAAANTRPPSKHAKGRCIVKFRSAGPYAVTASVPSLLKSGRRNAFRDATADRSDSLDRLHSRLHVQRAEHLFHEEGEEPPSADATAVVPIARIQEAAHKRSDRIKKKFAQRQARAPRGAAEPDFAHTYVISIPGTADVDAVCREYAADPHVEYCQPDYLMKAIGTVEPNDPQYASGALWGIKRIQANSAWMLTQGKGVVVAVVDTGIDQSHPDIAPNVWQNDDPLDGVDNDGNGFVDDISGWNFVAGNNLAYDGNGHGTHVAGTIGAVGDNGLDVVGVAYQAKVMAVKVLDAHGVGALTTVAAGMRYAVDNGADVMNLSLGCSFPGCPSSPLEEDMVRYAASHGTVVVLAAGNEDDDTMYYSPQNMAEPLVVSAINANNLKAKFSDFGSSVDLAAPGVNIVSLHRGGGVISYSGTSMAAPHVAGVAALVLSQHPTWSVAEVEARLCQTATDLGAPGRDPTYGCGLVNAGNAVDHVMLRVNGSHDPITLEFGTPLYVAWNSNGTQCSLIDAEADGRSFLVSRAVSGTFSPGLATTSETYTLTCTGPFGTASDSVAVTVPPPLPPAVDAKVAVKEFPTQQYDGPVETFPSGSRVLLTWQAQGTYVECYAILYDRVTQRRQQFGPFGLTGNLETEPFTTPHSATVTCGRKPLFVTLPDGSVGISQPNVEDSIDINPGPAVDITFHLTDGAGHRLPVVAPETPVSAQLSWTSRFGTSCTASQTPSVLSASSWSGTKATSGVEDLSLKLRTDTIFQLSCTGPYGTSTRGSRVLVSPHYAVVDLKVGTSDAGPFTDGPITVPPDAPLYFSWASLDTEIRSPSACHAFGGWSGDQPASSSGSVQIGPPVSAGTYALGCYTPGVANQLSTGYDAVTVYVGSQTPLLVLEGAASPSGPYTAAGPLALRVGFGLPLYLRWTASGLQTCQASGAWSGMLGPVGEYSVPRVTASGRYGLSCRSGETVITKSLAVVVPEAASNAPDLTVASLTHTKTRATVGQTVALTAMVANNGLSPAGPNTLNLALVGSTGATAAGYTVDLPVPALAPGASTSLSGTFMITDAGTYTPLAVVDKSNQVQEMNKQNNEFRDTSHPITVPAPVTALTPSSVEPYVTTALVSSLPSVAIDGDTIPVSYRLANSSADTFGALFLQQMIVQGATQRAAGGYPLRCQEFATYGALSGMLPPGSCTISSLMGANDTTSWGSGTFTPGPANFVVELRLGSSGSVLLKTFSFPITLNPVPLLLVDLKIAPGSNPTAFTDGPLTTARSPYPLLQWTVSGGASRCDITSNPSTVISAYDVYPHSGTGAQWVSGARTSTITMTCTRSTGETASDSVSLIVP